MGNNWEITKKMKHINLLGTKRFSSALLYSSGWSKNYVDMRHMNRRKLNKILITYIHGRDPGKLSNLPKWPNTHFNYHLQLKRKEDIGGSGLGLQVEGRQYAWGWKSKWLVNKCLLGQAETMGHRKEQTLPGSTLSTHLVHTTVIYRDSSLPGTGSLFTFF